MQEISKSAVESFLIEFRTRMDIFDVIFESREKNIQGLLDLEITPMDRKRYLKLLKVENYLSGPNADTNDISRYPYWEVGRSI